MAAAIPFVIAAFQVMGSISSANAQRDAGKAEEAAYNVRASLAEQQGQQEEQMSRDRLKKLISTQRSLYAKAGVDLSSGSPLSLLADTAAEGEMEALNIRLGAQKEAANQRWSGASARVAADKQANATLLTGFGNAAMGAFSGSKGSF